MKVPHCFPHLCVCEMCLSKEAQTVKSKGYCIWAWLCRLMHCFANSVVMLTQSKNRYILYTGISPSTYFVLIILYTTTDTYSSVGQVKKPGLLT